METLSNVDMDIFMCQRVNLKDLLKIIKALSMRYYLLPEAAVTNIILMCCL